MRISSLSWRPLVTSRAFSGCGRIQILGRFHDLIVATGSAAPLALVGEGFAGPAQWVGILLFAVVIALSYRWVSRQSELGPVPPGG